MSEGPFTCTTTNRCDSIARKLEMGRYSRKFSDFVIDMKLLKFVTDNAQTLWTSCVIIAKLNLWLHTFNCSLFSWKFLDIKIIHQSKLRRLGSPNQMVDDSDSKPSKFDCWLRYKSNSKDRFESMIAISM